MHRNSFFDRIQNAITETLLEHFADLYPSVKFIEVGAYDGKTRSHIQSIAKLRGWTGLCIEPQLTAFAALSATYADFPSIASINCAVGRNEGTLPFFTVRNDDKFDTAAMSSSLDRAVIVSQKNYISDIEDRIEEVLVPVKSLTRVARENGYSKIDLLKVDTEGRDDDVILSADLKILNPTLILYEHRLVPVPRLQLLDAVLLRHGYRQMVMWADTVCIRGDFAHESNVARLLDQAPMLFPPGRDPEWGNGNWVADQAH